MADSHRLQIAQRRYNANDHFLQFILLPESTRSFTLAEHMFQVCATVHILADHRNSERIVHSLVEIIAEKLEYIGVALDLKELNSFLLFEKIQ